MRVISGSAKGIKLANVPGKSTRPITDQVKEALFNIIGVDIIDKTFLDLFGGTGAVGIEALSRGASEAVFLEINYRAYKTIQQNLKTTGLSPYGNVNKIDAFMYLRSVPKYQFDYVYIAPPQYQGLWHKAMQTLDENPGWLSPENIAIVQIHPKELLETVQYQNFSEYDRRSYGDTMLMFFNKVSVEENG